MLPGLMCMGALASCFPLYECSHTLLFEVPSPKNLRVATVFEWDCGATAAANVQLRIRTPDKKPSFKKATSVLVYEGGRDLQVQWVDEGSLTVRIPPNSKVFRKDPESMGVRITYEDQPAQGGRAVP